MQRFKITATVTNRWRFQLFLMILMFIMAAFTVVTFIMGNYPMMFAAAFWTLVDIVILWRSIPKDEQSTTTPSQK